MIYDGMRSGSLLDIRQRDTAFVILVSFLLILLSKFVVQASYNVWFHPLRKIPGPRFAVATPIPFAWRLWNGRMVKWTTSLHNKYGKIVRIHPNELSFVDNAAWQDIFGSARRPELQKPDLGTIQGPNAIRPLPAIINIDDYTRQRRIVEHAFTSKALKEQEHLLQKHTDTFIKCVTNIIRQSAGNAEIDLCSWFYFTTFDIIGDLTFSEEFHSLENAEAHKWLARVFKGIGFGKQLTAFDHFPPLGAIVRWCISRVIRGSLRQNFDWVVEKIDRRIRQKSDRPDFLKYVLENNDKQGMSKAEIDSTMSLLLLAGSGDTTVAAMTALTYSALQIPKAMARLQEEIRGAIGDNPENITVAAIEKLEYLDAALRESMRLHAPSPTSNPRIVDRPGVQICGISIPEGTRVGIPQKTAYRLACNFVEPESFLPERWLPDPQGRFDADNKAVFEPFMVGPRRCIGKTLALAEMKLILAKLFWHFDIELSEKSQDDWTDQRSYLANEKKPLYVKLSVRSLAVTKSDCEGY